jgi:hypothetical protein
MISKIINITKTSTHKLAQVKVPFHFHSNEPFLVLDFEVKLLYSLEKLIKKNQRKAKSKV